MNHAEEADTLAALPGSYQGRPCKGGAVLHLLSARDALLVVRGGPSILRDMIERCGLKFYLKYHDNTYLGPYQHLYESKYNSFIEHVDSIFFEYNSFNSILTGRESYKLIKIVHYSEGENVNADDADRASASIKAELEQARQENAALQAELEKTRAELERTRQAKEQGALSWYGLIAVVEQCRKEGKTPQETAACLKERGASLAIIGALLHPQGDIKDWQQYGKDLFNGSTKTLPW